MIKKAYSLLLCFSVIEGFVTVFAASSADIELIREFENLRTIETRTHQVCARVYNHGQGVPLEKDIVSGDKRIDNIVSYYGGPYSVDINIENPFSRE